MPQVVGYNYSRLISAYTILVVKVMYNVVGAWVFKSGKSMEFSLEEGAADERGRSYALMIG